MRRILCGTCSRAAAPHLDFAGAPAGLTRPGSASTGRLAPTMGEDPWSFDPHIDAAVFSRVLGGKGPAATLFAQEGGDPVDDYRSGSAEVASS